jgi:chromosome segregation and condensation protein ScpB
METLEGMGWVRAEPQANGAKHPAAWQLNPKLHKTFAAQAAAERERRQRAKDEMLEAIRRHRQENSQ